MLSNLMSGYIKKFVLILAITYTVTGCATITSGTTQSLMVKTEKNVIDASCELTDKKGGKWYVPETPSAVTVRKGDGPMSIVCKKDGFKVGTLSVDETLVGATFGNIILGGGIGIFVDAASGAAQQYPDEVIIWMEPEEWSSVEEKLAWKKEKQEFDATKSEKQQQPQETTGEL